MAPNNNGSNKSNQENSELSEFDQIKQEINDLAEKAKSPEERASKIQLSKINTALDRVKEQKEMYPDKNKGVQNAARALSTEASNSRKAEDTENTLLTRIENAEILNTLDPSQFENLYKHVSSKHAESKKARAAARKAEHEARQSPSPSLSDSSPRSRESGQGASQGTSSPKSNRDEPSPKSSHEEPSPTHEEPTPVSNQRPPENGKIKSTDELEEEIQELKARQSQLEPERRQLNKLSHLDQKIESSPDKEKEILEREKGNFQEDAKKAAAELQNRGDIPEQAKPKAEETKQDFIDNLNIKNHLSNDPSVRENQLEFLANKNSELIINNQETALEANAKQAAEIDPKNMPLNAKLESLKQVREEVEDIDGKIYAKQEQKSVAEKIIEEEVEKDEGAEAAPVSPKPAENGRIPMSKEEYKNTSERLFGNTRDIAISGGGELSVRGGGQQPSVNESENLQTSKEQDPARHESSEGLDEILKTSTKKRNNKLSPLNGESSKKQNPNETDLSDKSQEGQEVNNNGPNKPSSHKVKTKAGKEHYNAKAANASRNKLQEQSLSDNPKKQPNLTAQQKREIERQKRQEQEKQGTKQTKPTSSNPKLNTVTSPKTGAIVNSRGFEEELKSKLENSDNLEIIQNAMEDKNVENRSLNKKVAKELNSQISKENKELNQIGNYLTRYPNAIKTLGNVVQEKAQELAAEQSLGDNRGEEAVKENGPAQRTQVRESTEPQIGGEGQAQAGVSTSQERASLRESAESSISNEEQARTGVSASLQERAGSPAREPVPNPLPEHDRPNPEGANYSDPEAGASAAEVSNEPQRPSVYNNIPAERLSEQEIQQRRNEEQNKAQNNSQAGGADNSSNNMPDSQVEPESTNNMPNSGNAAAASQDASQAEATNDVPNSGNAVSGQRNEPQPEAGNSNTGAAEAEAANTGAAASENSSSGKSIEALRDEVSELKLDRHKKLTDYATRNRLEQAKIDLDNSENDIDTQVDTLKSWQNEFNDKAKQALKDLTPNLAGEPRVEAQKYNELDRDSKLNLANKINNDPQLTSNEAKNDFVANVRAAETIKTQQETIDPNDARGSSEGIGDWLGKSAKSLSGAVFGGNEPNVSTEELPVNREINGLRNVENEMSNLNKDFEKKNAELEKRENALQDLKQTPAANQTRTREAAAEHETPQTGNQQKKSSLPESSMEPIAEKKEQKSKPVKEAEERAAGDNTPGNSAAAAPPPPPDKPRSFKGKSSVGQNPKQAAANRSLRGQNPQSSASKSTEGQKQAAALSQAEKQARENAQNSGHERTYNQQSTNQQNNPQPPPEQRGSSYSQVIESSPKEGNIVNPRDFEKEVDSKLADESNLAVIAQKLPDELPKNKKKLGRLANDIRNTEGLEQIGSYLNRNPDAFGKLSDKVKEQEPQLQTKSPEIREVYSKSEGPYMADKQNTSKQNQQENHPNHEASHEAQANQEPKMNDTPSRGIGGMPGNILDGIRNKDKSKLRKTPKNKSKKPENTNQFSDQQGVESEARRIGQKGEEQVVESEGTNQDPNVKKSSKEYFNPQDEPKEPKPTSKTEKLTEEQQEKQRQKQENTKKDLMAQLNGIVPNLDTAHSEKPQTKADGDINYEDVNRAKERLRKVPEPEKGQNRKTQINTSQSELGEIIRKRRSAITGERLPDTAEVNQGESATPPPPGPQSNEGSSSNNNPGANPPEPSSNNEQQKTVPRGGNPINKRSLANIAAKFREESDTERDDSDTEEEKEIGNSSNLSEQPQDTDKTQSKRRSSNLGIQAMADAQNSQSPGNNSSDSSVNNEHRAASGLNKDTTNEKAQGASPSNEPTRGETNFANNPRTGRETSPGPNPNEPQATTDLQDLPEMPKDPKIIKRVRNNLDGLRNDLTLGSEGSPFSHKKQEIQKYIEEKQSNESLDKFDREILQANEKTLEILNHLEEAKTPKDKLHGEVNRIQKSYEEKAAELEAAASFEGAQGRQPQTPESGAAAASSETAQGWQPQTPESGAAADNAGTTQDGPQSQAAESGAADASSETVQGGQPQTPETGAVEATSSETAQGGQPQTPETGAAAASSASTQGQQPSKDQNLPAEEKKKLQEEYRDNQARINEIRYQYNHDNGVRSRDSSAMDERDIRDSVKTQLKDIDEGIRKELKDNNPSDELVNNYIKNQKQNLREERRNNFGKDQNSVEANFIVSGVLDSAKGAPDKPASPANIKESIRDIEKLDKLEQKQAELAETLGAETPGFGTKPMLRSEGIGINLENKRNVPKGGSKNNEQNNGLGTGNRDSVENEMNNTQVPNGTTTSSQLRLNPSETDEKFKKTREDSLAQETSKQQNKKERRRRQKQNRENRKEKQERAQQNFEQNNLMQGQGGDPERSESVFDGIRTHAEQANIPKKGRGNDNNSRATKRPDTLEKVIEENLDNLDTIQEVIKEIQERDELPKQVSSKNLDPENKVRNQVIQSLQDEGRDLRSRLKGMTQWIDDIQNGRSRGHGQGDPQVGVNNPEAASARDAGAGTDPYNGTPGQGANAVSRNAPGVSGSGAGVNQGPSDVGQSNSDTRKKYDENGVEIKDLPEGTRATQVNTARENDWRVTSGDNNTQQSNPTSQEPHQTQTETVQPNEGTAFDNGRRNNHGIEKNDISESVKKLDEYGIKEDNLKKLSPESLSKLEDYIDDAKGLKYYTEIGKRQYPNKTMDKLYKAKSGEIFKDKSFNDLQNKTNHAENKLSGYKKSKDLNIEELRAFDEVKDSIEQNIKTDKEGKNRLDDNSIVEMKDAITEVKQNSNKEAGENLLTGNEGKSFEAPEGSYDRKSLTEEKPPQGSFEAEDAIQGQGTNSERNSTGIESSYGYGGERKRDSFDKALNQRGASSNISYDSSSEGSSQIDGDNAIRIESGPSTDVEVGDHSGSNGSNQAQREMSEQQANPQDHSSQRNLDDIMRNLPKKSDEEKEIYWFIGEIKKTQESEISNTIKQSELKTKLGKEFKNAFNQRLQDGYNSQDVLDGINSSVNLGRTPETGESKERTSNKLAQYEVNQDTGSSVTGASTPGGYRESVPGGPQASTSGGPENSSTEVPESNVASGGDGKTPPPPPPRPSESSRDLNDASDQSPNSGNNGQSNPREDTTAHIKRGNISVPTPEKEDSSSLIQEQSDNVQLSRLSNLSRGGAPGDGSNNFGTDDNGYSNADESGSPSKNEPKLPGSSAFYDQNYNRTLNGKNLEGELPSSSQFTGYHEAENNSTDEEQEKEPELPNSSEVNYPEESGVFNGSSTSDHRKTSDSDPGTPGGSPTDESQVPTESSVMDEVRRNVEAVKRQGIETGQGGSQDGNSFNKEAGTSERNSGLSHERQDGTGFQPSNEHNSGLLNEQQGTTGVPPSEQELRGNTGFDPTNPPQVTTTDERVSGGEPFTEGIKDVVSTSSRDSDEIYKIFEKMERDQDELISSTGAGDASREEHREANLDKENGLILDPKSSLFGNNPIGKQLKEAQQEAYSQVQSSGLFNSVDSIANTRDSGDGSKAKTINDEKGKPMLTVNERTDENGVRKLDMPEKLDGDAKGPLHYAAALKDTNGKDSEPPMYITYHYNKEGKLDKVTNPLDMEKDKDGNLSMTDEKGKKVYAAVDYDTLAKQKDIAASQARDKTMEVEVSKGPGGSSRAGEEKDRSGARGRQDETRPESSRGAAKPMPPPSRKEKPLRKGEESVRITENNNNRASEYNAYRDNEARVKTTKETVYKDTTDKEIKESAKPLKRNQLKQSNQAENSIPGIAENFRGKGNGRSGGISR